MSNATLERTVDDVIAGWRDGDLDGNPAGPLFSEGYAAQEITMTGAGGTGMPFSEMSGSYDPCTGMYWNCC